MLYKIYDKYNAQGKIKAESLKYLKINKEVSTKNRNFFVDADTLTSISADANTIKNSDTRPCQCFGTLLYNCYHK